MHNRRVQMKNMEAKRHLENVFNGDEDLYWKNPCGGIYIPSATAILTPGDFFDLKAKVRFHINEPQSRNETNKTFLILN